MQTNKKSRLIHAAIIGLVGFSALSTSGLSSSAADDDAKASVDCWGVNKCKGKGACGGAGSSCAGTNKCKAQGFLTISKADCLKKGGSLKPLTAEELKKKVGKKKG